MIAALEMFFLGVLAAMFVVAGIFFLRFWRESRDPFFLAFAVSFLIRGLNRFPRPVMAQPNVGSPWNYVIDLCASLLIVAAIVRKNMARK